MRPAPVKVVVVVLTKRLWINYTFGFVTGEFICIATTTTTTSTTTTTTTSATPFTSHSRQTSPRRSIEISERLRRRSQRKRARGKTESPQEFYFYFFFFDKSSATNVCSEVSWLKTKRQLKEEESDKEVLFFLLHQSGSLKPWLVKIFRCREEGSVSTNF